LGTGACLVSPQDGAREVLQLRPKPQVALKVFEDVQALVVQQSNVAVGGEYLEVEPHSVEM